MFLSKQISKSIKESSLTLVTDYILKPHLYMEVFFQQVLSMGFYSLSVVSITAFFSGAVLALQSYNSFPNFMVDNSIALIVVVSITKELGPVLTGLMISGRVGSSIAAEIATMRVTEQIDALYTLSTDPIKYLLLPRILSCVIVLPLLVLVSDVIGIMGGYFVGVYKLGLNSSSYLINTLKYLQLIDVLSGLIKAISFGFIIALTSCYYGYNSSIGAKGVGVSTTSAVVVSSILILLSNYLITLILL